MKRLALVAVAAVAALAPTPAGWVERLYSSGFYPLWQRVVTTMSNLAPASLFDVALVAGPAALLWWWARTIARATRGRRLRAIGGLLAGTLACMAGAYLWFLGSWGLNYRREPLRAARAFDASRVREERLIDLAARSVTALNRLHGPAHAEGWPATSAMGDVLAVPFDRARRELAAARLGARPPDSSDHSPPIALARPRRTLLSLLFRRAGVDGMTDPFFLEVLIHDDLLPFERPFVVAHEWAHLAGLANEAEASLLGWLACQRATAGPRYSGWLYLYGQLGGSVPASEWARLAGGLELGPRADLRAIAARFASVSPGVQRASAQTYDRFLRANRVEEGIASYAEVVTLILGLGM